MATNYQNTAVYLWPWAGLKAWNQTLFVNLPSLLKAVSMGLF
jgi:hypothetical protein